LIAALKAFHRSGIWSKDTARARATWRKRMIRQSAGRFGEQIMRSLLIKSAIGRKTGFHFC
jgi:hypothetical protein